MYNSPACYLPFEMPACPPPHGQPRDGHEPARAGEAWHIQGTARPSCTGNVHDLQACLRELDPFVNPKIRRSWFCQATSTDTKDGRSKAGAYSLTNDGRFTSNGSTSSYQFGRIAASDFYGGRAAERSSRSCIFDLQMKGFIRCFSKQRTKNMGHASGPVGCVSVPRSPRRHRTF